jgi:hypothetical protein
MTARAASLVAPLAQWLRAEAQAGRLPSVHDHGAAAKLRHGECVGAWLSLHELGTAAPQWNELLASPAPEAGRDRGLIYLLPEVLCAYLAQQTGCTPAEAQPLAAELLCELVRQRCAGRPHVPEGHPGWPGLATGQPDAAQWPWRHWPACTTFPGVGQVYTVVLKLPVLRADAPQAFAAA